MLLYDFCISIHGRLFVIYHELAQENICMAVLLYLSASISISWCVDHHFLLFACRCFISIAIFQPEEKVSIYHVLSRL